MVDLRNLVVASELVRLDRKSRMAYALPYAGLKQSRLPWMAVVRSSVTTQTRSPEESSPRGSPDDAPEVSEVNDDRERRSEDCFPETGPQPETCPNSYAVERHEKGGKRCRLWLDQKACGHQGPQRSPAPGQRQARESRRRAGDPRLTGAPASVGKGGNREFS